MNGPASIMTEDQISQLLEPIENPSGIWADYNPVRRWYDWVKTVLPPDRVPSEPSVADYPDLTSPRSSRWMGS
jgi:hypothetical protein